MRGHLCVLAAAVLLLSGCGETRGERAVTGAGIGAGAGAVVGAITGLGPGTGAIVGATAGGIAGFLTDKAELNLGDAPWESSSEAAPSPQAAQTESPPESESTAPAEAAAVEPAAGPPQQQAYAATPADRETIRDIQSGLVTLGFDPGPVDGIAGSRTRDAIRAFQQQYGIPADGLATTELAAQIQEKLAAN